MHYNITQIYCAVSAKEQQQGGIFVTSRKMYELVMAAIFIALIAMLSFTPIGFLQISIVSVTVIHIPVIIGGITLHRRFYYGIIFGLAFGICSFLRALTASPFEVVVFTDPRISVIPRIVVGIVVIAVFNGLTKIFKRKEIAYGLTAVAATLTNTITVIGSILIFHSEDIRTFNVAADALQWFLVTVLSLNVVAEVLSSVIISVPVCMAVDRASRQFTD